MAGMLPEMVFLLPLDRAVFVTECIPILSCLNLEIVTECALFTLLLQRKGVEP
jgi:hypothetical protein